MALEGLAFADIAVGKEAVGDLGVLSILKRRGQRPPRPLPESFEHCP